jgi:hypothetical protein
MAGDANGGNPTWLRNHNIRHLALQKQFSPDNYENL